jgi:hypothetical protein
MAVWQGRSEIGRGRADIKKSIHGVTTVLDGKSLSALKSKKQ